MIRTAHRSNPPARQRGVVLFVGLVMLLLLTLIGIAAMQVTVLQERMAGNFYAQHVGFEDTEALLANGRDTAHANKSSYASLLSLGPGNSLPWDAWLTGEPVLPSPPQISCVYVSWATCGSNTSLAIYSVATVGGDASGDAKTALQGIYIF